MNARLRSYLVILFLAFRLFANAVTPVTSVPLIGATREISFTGYNPAPDNPSSSNVSGNNTDPTKTTPEQDSVFALDSYIKDNQRFIDKIDKLTLMELPVGIQRSGSLEYTILIKRLIITPDSGAFLEAYMSFEIPQSGRKIAFAAKRIPFSFSGGIRGDVRLELMGDQGLAISKDILLNFKGDGGTYVAFDCNGFKSMGIKAEVEFSANIIVPEKPDGTVDTKNTVKAAFSTTIFDWNDLLVELTLPPFEVTGLTGVGFQVKHAVFDFSDLNNAPGMTFPNEYRSTYFANGMDIKLWRGFYLRELTVKLPEEFKSKENNNRLTLDINNLIIDERGVSGSFGVQNLPLFQNMDMDSWAFTIDNFYIKLVASQLTEGGFSGKMNIPMFKENSLLDYATVIGTGGNYSFTVNSEKPVEIPLWSAKLELLKTSKITIAMQGGKFKPQADLTGNISIGKSSGGNDLVSVPKLSFEHLIIRTQKPYVKIGSMSLGSNGEKSNMGNFPIGLKNIGFKTEDERIGITFTISVSLMGDDEEGFGAGGGFIVWGKRDSSDNKWKFDGIEVTELSVDVAKPGAFELHGRVVFFRGDSTYGKGFRGELKAKFGGSIELQAIALFGCVNSMRYWYADAMVNLENGIPCGTFSIYGFGGGAYHHMRQQGFNENKGSALGASRSGIIYIPTPDVSLGLKASISLGTVKKEVINGDVTFEISFSSHGGINQIAFEGNAYLITCKFTSAMSDVSGSAKGLSGGQKTPSKTDDNSRAQIWGSIRLLFDNANHVFHGEIKVYANIAGGLIKGIGENGLAGWCVIHFAPSEWYVHMGTPTNPIGINIANTLKLRSYFMVGHHIPGSPPPPAKVSEILGNIDLDYMRDLNSLGEGKGIAFGASIEISADLKFLMFYASLNAGIGFDIMLKDYGNIQCLGRDGTIGINGWFANGQAYAYIEGKIGLKVDLPFYKGSYEILNVGMAAVLQTMGPNPFWMRGIVGGRYSILNGAVKGDCRFQFTLGEKCEIETTNPLGDIKIISEVTPASGTKDVDVFNTPQAVFNMPVGKEFSIKNEEGVNRIFRIKLDLFKLYLPDNSEVPGSIVWNSENDVAGFKNADIFPTQKDIRASVQVSFEEKVNGGWRVVLVKGVKAIESMESSFTSGIAPDYIPLTNVEYSYPVINQYNFYKNEYNQGYIKLKKGQPYLFTAPTGFYQKGRLKSDPADQHLFNIAYNNGTVTYTLPEGLNNNKIYTLDLVNIPATEAQAIDRNVDTVTTKITDSRGVTDVEITTKNAEGTIETLQEKAILTYYFRTSKYSTFSEKIGSMTISSGWRRPIRINVHELGVNISGDELFDMMETHWTDAITPTVQFEAAFSETPWYTNIMGPILYNNYPIVESARIDWRDVSVLGAPPSKAEFIRQYPNDRMLTEADLSGPTGFGTPNEGGFVYNVAHFADQDFYNYRSKLATAYTNRPIDNSQVTQILGSLFPGIKYGDYPVDVKYVLPGINTVTSTKRIVIHNPIPDS
jgi:hypothetical protein